MPAPTADSAKLREIAAYLDTPNVAATEDSWYLENLAEKLDREPPVLADLMALRIEGPTVVIVRPRMVLDPARSLALDEGLRHLTNEMHGLGMNVTFVGASHDLDLMAIGDVDLARYGLQRLPSSSELPQPTFDPQHPEHT